MAQLFHAFGKFIAVGGGNSDPRWRDGSHLLWNIVGWTIGQR
ncbi:MAG TPA: hypothetical protein VJS65_07575 [Verrucomicrobiae bacterium]|nr:hypothetical protein [Verrucomicrobiae bacterium]